MPFFLLLVEDNYDLADSVIQYLSLEGIVCDHAASGEAGLGLARENRYDVILLDIMLPRLNGLQVCDILRKEGDDTPILMLTARDTLNDKIVGFRSGTDDYLVKPFDMEELIVRVKALARRRSGQARVITAVDISMNLETGQAFRGNREVPLTPTGRILLETLVRAHPAVVPRQKLARAVWGEDPPESNSLKVHLHKLRRVLNPEGDEPVFHTVTAQGYVLRRDDEAPA